MKHNEMARGEEVLENNESKCSAQNLNEQRIRLKTTSVFFMVISLR
jgi:hypothetical protein